MNKQDDSLAQWAPHAQQASISTSGSTQKPSIKGPPHLLSPTIEESPSPRVETKFSHGHQKATNHISSDLTQKAYPISSDTPPSQARESSSEGSVIRPVIVENELVTGAGNTIPGTFRSPARKPGTPSPSPSVVKQNKTHIIPHSDTGLSSPGDIGDVTIIEATSDDSSKVNLLSSSSNPTTTQAAPRHEHGAGAPNLKSLPQMSMNNGDGAVRLPDLGDTTSRVRNHTDFENEVLARGPADQWRSLVASSKASTESLAKSAKERRLKRNFVNTSSGLSRELSNFADSRPKTPERKQQQVQDRRVSGRNTTFNPPYFKSPRRTILPRETF